MVKIRLRRVGRTHHPQYRVVVSDSRRRPTSSVLETVGYYDPHQEPSEIRLDRDRITHWLGNGAQMSKQVQVLWKQQAKPAPAPAEAPPAAAPTPPPPEAAAAPAAEEAPAAPDAEA